MLGVILYLILVIKRYSFMPILKIIQLLTGYRLHQFDAVAKRIIDVGAAEPV